MFGRHSDAVSLYLIFLYPPTYPDVPPDLSFDPTASSSSSTPPEALTTDEEQSVLASLRQTVRLRLVISVFARGFLKRRGCRDTHDGRC